jgi:hypothetical protein
VHPERVPADVREQLLEMARARGEYPDIDNQFLGAARSMMGILARRSSYLATMAAIRVPVLLLHGEKDRLVTIGASREVSAANPSWRFEVAPDVGHVPQLEVPEWTAARILEWLATDVVGRVRTDKSGKGNRQKMTATEDDSHTDDSDTAGSDIRDTDTGERDRRLRSDPWSS